MTWISCSWCDSLNAATERWCWECGHRADRARLECDCQTCRRETPVNLMRWAADWREGWQEQADMLPFD